MISRSRIIDETGRIFYPHDLWECWKNGLYDVSNSNDEYIQKSIDVLSSEKVFYDRIVLLSERWPHSFEFNISNKSINRKAWLGQAACCILYGSPYNATIKAWWRMSDSERKAANDIALRHIIEFERGHYAKNTIREKRSGRCERTYFMDF